MTAPSYVVRALCPGLPPCYWTGGAPEPFDWTVLEDGRYARGLPLRFSSEADARPAMEAALRSVEGAPQIRIDICREPERSAA